jgi:hypothetical protein
MSSQFVQEQVFDLLDRDRSVDQEQAPQALLDVHWSHWNQ